MKNFTSSRFFFGLIFVLLLLGCSSTIPYYYSDNSNREFIVLGEVTYVGKIVYFGPFGRGNAAFQTLFNEAKIKYNADYVINVTIEQTTIFNFFTLFGFWTQTYTMRGTAIKYIQRNSDGEIILVSLQNSEINPRVTSADIADYYIITSITGRVRRGLEFHIEGVWVDARVGDVISKDSFVNTSADSSLTITDGNRIITIPAIQTGKLADLVSRFQ